MADRHRSKNKIVVIGGGYAGLAAATRAAYLGYDVTLLEKNTELGGRGYVMEAHGSTFDMGPSWYMMPELIDQWFESVGRKREDYYDLVTLDPSYRIFYEDDILDVSSDRLKAKKLFDRLEPGGGAALDAFLERSRAEYELAVGKYIRNTYLSPRDGFHADLLAFLTRSLLTGSYWKKITKSFSSHKARQIVSFPSVFLGGTPQNIFSAFTLVTHADFGIGIQYPNPGGFGALTKAMTKIAEELNVNVVTNSGVTKVTSSANYAQKVHTADTEYAADYVIAACDYEHMETVILSEKQRSIKPTYWNKAVYSPSCLLLYWTYKGDLPKLTHHNLFFNDDYAQHYASIYTTHELPKRPQFYVSITSKTDTTVAPDGHHTIFILIPISSKVTSSDDYVWLRNYAIKQMALKEPDFKPENIVYEKIVTPQEFADRFNARGGQTFGLAHTLRQSALWRPKNKSAVLNNLYYAGQSTNPGTGTSLSIISGVMAADLLDTESHKNA